VSLYSQYERNGAVVWVRNDLKGRQKEFCMCWDCRRFAPEREDRGCPIINEVLTLAAVKKIVLPVWECQAFQQK